MALIDQRLVENSVEVDVIVNDDDEAKGMAELIEEAFGSDTPYYKEKQAKGLLERLRGRYVCFKRESHGARVTLATR